MHVAKARSKRVTPRKLIVFAILAIVVMLVAAVLAFFSARMQLQGPIHPSLVGTWHSVGSEEDPHGLGDSIWQLREDGTARWRLSSGKTLGSAGNTVGYFEWWMQGPDELVVHQYSSEAAAKRSRVISAVLGPQGGRSAIELMEVTENAFKIRSKNGQVSVYRRTEDETLTSEP